MNRAEVVEGKGNHLVIVEPDDIRIVRDRSLYERRLKRPFDVVCGSVAAIATLPVASAIAVAIRFGLGRGVLYSQDRVGVGRQPFTIYKFRTMRPDRRRQQVDVAEVDDRRAGHKREDDPRHTGLGRRLRKASLDELPQLINVLKGDMSLVGPRPELVDVARQRGYLNHPRHDVKPGMTGPYQVSELRLNADLRDGLDLDAHYVENLTFRNDVRYLWKTVTMIVGRATGT